jgi:AcrR family transcriptional regulator
MSYSSHIAKRSTQDPVGRQDGRRTDRRGTARERLLDAAARVFAERGYRGASVEDVAAEAGVTKGALYWNFKSKEDVLFALLEERVDQRVQALIEHAEAAAGDDTITVLVSQVMSEVMDQERQMLLLTHEYWSLAARDPALNVRYVARQRAFRDAVARAVAAYASTTRVPLTMTAAKLATALVSLANGLAMERMADPESVPDELLGEILALIYDGLVLRSTSPEKPPGD